MKKTDWITESISNLVWGDKAKHVWRSEKMARSGYLKVTYYNQWNIKAFISFLWCKIYFKASKCRLFPPEVIHGLFITLEDTDNLSPNLKWLIYQLNRSESHCLQLVASGCYRFWFRINEHLVSRSFRQSSLQVSEFGSLHLSHLKSRGNWSLS